MFAVAQSPEPARIHIVSQEGNERFFGVIKSIYQQMGFEVDFHLVPAERALALVNSGRFDAEMGRIHAPDSRYANLHYSAEPLLKTQLLALTKKGSKLRLQSAWDLRTLRLGYVNGMTAAETFVKQHRLRALSISTHQQLKIMLEQDRLDVVLMGTAFKQSPVFQVAQSQLVLSSANVYHIFHKRYAHLSADFDRILAEMKKDGRYQQLMATEVSTSLALP